MISMYLCHRGNDGWKKLLPFRPWAGPDPISYQNSCSASYVWAGPHSTVYFYLSFVLRNSLMNSIDMQVIHISYHITATKYNNFKMINLIYMIFILNFIFTIVFYAMK
jgi:hypothetical protein